MYSCQRLQERSVIGLDSQMITLTLEGGTQVHSETARESVEDRKRNCCFSEGMLASIHKLRQKNLESISRVEKFSASLGRVVLFELVMFWDGREFDPHRWGWPQS